MPHVLAMLLWAPGPSELIIVVVAILILFGGSKLPQLMRGMGTGIKEFKQAIRDDGEPADKTDKAADKDKADA